MGPATGFDSSALHHAGIVIQHALASYGYLAVGVGIFIESAGMPFPGESILVAAAFFAAQGHLHLAGVLLAAALGATLGDNLGYFIGRRYGRGLLCWMRRHKLLRQSHLDQAEHYFQHHGSAAVFFGRFVSLLRMFAGPLAGMHRMPYRRFLLCNAAGAILWAVLIGNLGYYFGQQWEQAHGYVRLFGVFGWLGIFLPFLIMPLLSRAGKLIGTSRTYWQARLVRKGGI